MDGFWFGFLGSFKGNMKVIKTSPLRIDMGPYHVLHRVHRWTGICHLALYTPLVDHHLDVCVNSCSKLLYDCLKFQRLIFVHSLLCSHWIEVKAYFVLIYTS